MNRQKRLAMRHKTRQKRVRKKVKGTPARPRLCVFKSARHIYAQLIDDANGCTLLTQTSLHGDFKSQSSKGGNVAAAKFLGELLAVKALEKGVSSVVFDRNGYLYHGRVKAVADGAREKGLIF